MTITIHLPDQLEGKLRERLDKDDTPLDEFVSQAIAEKLEREPPMEKTGQAAYKSWLKHYKGWSSGESDRSERAEEILKEMFDAKRRNR